MNNEFKCAKQLIRITISFTFLLLSCSKKQTELNIWKFKTGDNLNWVNPHYDDSNWKPIKVGMDWESQGYSTYDGYAWYRFRFSLPSSLKNNSRFKEALLIELGKIDDCDQTFLNGKLLGQNGEFIPADSIAALQDLSKVKVAFNVPRNYSISVDDPRILWNQENVLAIRVFDVAGPGGMYTLPVNIRMKDLKDYLTFDLDSKVLETKFNGILSKTITIKNFSPIQELKGKLTMDFTDANNKQMIAAQTTNVNLTKEEKTFTINFKGDIFLPMIATYTFVESNTDNKVIYIREPDCSGGWVKYENNPILGGHLGTIFDPQSVLRTDEGIYQMFCSWRNKMSIAVSESKDGLKWSLPVICLRRDSSSSWEQDINRPMVIQKDGIYHMWYTAEVWSPNSRAWIGYAVSKDGKNWTRKSHKPVLSSEVKWEGVAVRCSHVIWDEQEQLFKMWYSAGEAFEPDGIGYATSKEGLYWKKYKNNPIFTHNQQNEWEKAKTTACQVIKRKHDYLMFYIGFKTPTYAQIGMARSKDGITNWERYEGNPIIKCGSGWDSEAIYKPFALPDPENNRWLLYFNARRAWHEQIGVAIHKGMDLGF